LACQPYTIATNLDTRFKQFRHKYRGCEDCRLHKTREKVVVPRGHVPCDILFIGDGPNESEDVIGYTFTGPDGLILDDLIRHAMTRLAEERTPLGKAEVALEILPHSVRGVINLVWCFTHIVVCKPCDTQGINAQLRDPRKEEIKACSGRLTEFLALAKPDLVVCLGRLATKYVVSSADYTLLHLDHPRDIMAKDKEQSDLAAKRFTLRLASAIENHLLP
jgi:uracil-DNA glycosylase